MTELIQVKLLPMEEADRNQFILDNQEAFRYGALEEFGVRDEHFEEGEEIISRRTIEECMDRKGAEIYRIILREEKVGGVVLQINAETKHNELALFFILPAAHSKGIGQAAWKALERQHPETKVWETCTPYFEKRNIHFYVNRCGFHIVEFFNPKHPDPNSPEGFSEKDTGGGGMFRFEKFFPADV